MKSEQNVIPTQGKKDLSLTTRELQNLYYLVENKSISDIAKILNITERSVHFYVCNIKLKLASLLSCL